MKFDTLAEAEIKTALEAVGAGAYEINLRTNKITRSKVHLKLFGFDGDSDLPDAHSFSRTVLPEDREALERVMAHSVREHRSVEIPLRVVLPEGRLRWVFIKGRAIYDSSGLPLRVVGISQDVTKYIRAKEFSKRRTKELSKAKEQLQRQTRLLHQTNSHLERYSSVVAHDLKTPLQSILLNAQLALHSKSKQGENIDNKLEAIMSLSKRMAHLIDDLLLQAQYSARPFVDVDSNKIINNVILNLSTIIEVDSARVFVNDYLPIVLANPTELGQLFQNVISNAIKYRSEKTPEIEICAREIRHYWLFTIKDNGIGIEAKDREKIFESFKRLPVAGQVEGSGLGLSICRKIVENAGGKIWVESEFGEGSIFNIAWPKVPLVPGSNSFESKIIEH